MSWGLDAAGLASVQPPWCSASLFLWGWQVGSFGVHSPQAWLTAMIHVAAAGGESRYHLIASARIPPRITSGGGGGAAGGGSEEQLLTAVLAAICVVLALCIAVLIRRRAGAAMMATRALRPGPGSQTHRGGPRR